MNWFMKFLDDSTNRIFQMYPTIDGSIVTSMGMEKDKGLAVSDLCNIRSCRMYIELNAQFVFDNTTISDAAK